jgi:Tfp pilus assembly protein PilN
MKSFVRPTKQIKALGKALAGSIIILIIFYGGFIFYKLNIINQIQDFQNQVKKIDNELANYSEFEEQEQILQTRIKLTQKLIDTHVYWTDILFFLENTTIKDITYITLSCNLDSSQKNIDNKNELIAKINIEGVGKDFATIKDQLLTFQKSENFIKTVEINELLSTKEQKKKKEFQKLEGIGFKIDIELQPGILQHTF